MVKGYDEKILDSCPNYNDLKRLALMMTSDESLFVLVTQEMDDESIILGDVSGIDVSSMIEESSGQVLGMYPRFRPIGDVVGEITTLLRKVFKKRDIDSLSKVYSTLMEYPKEDIVMGLIESMSKLNPEKQREIVEHVVGSPRRWKNKVAIEVVKRTDEQKNKRDSYDYYVCFKNLRNGDRRLVTFNNHASAAIYVMHLVDRVKRRDSCTPIDVIKNIDSLQSIYSKMFTGDDKIKGLQVEKIKDSRGNYVNEKLRLSQYYSDINKVINENLRDWDFVRPYRCESDSIVLLTPDCITIDKGIMPEDWNMVV